MKTVLTNERIQSIREENSTKYTAELMAFKFARDIEQAVLQSEQVQAWKRDAERLNWIEEECGADFVCFSQGDWVVDMTDNYGEGETLRDAINAAMEKQK